MKKQDLYLIGVILILAISVFIGYRLMNHGSGEEVVVYIGDTEYARLPLNQDAELEIKSSNNGKNHLIIKDGEASVSSASCPDHICVAQSGISETGEMIVCMPNQVIITIESNTQNDEIR